MAISRIQDLTGRTFGRLTIIGRAPDGKHHPRWLCRCTCGKETFVTDGPLKNGLTRSCGCLRIDMLTDRLRTHGMSGKSEHNIWMTMLDRCLNPNNTGFKRYGGRGITVCDRWETSFENFYSDMGARPSKKHSIDRIDNGKGYSPENCRWATKKEQMNNRRNNHIAEYLGDRMTLSQASERAGFLPRIVFDRVNRYGWTVERALSTPVRHIRKPTS